MNLKFLIGSENGKRPIANEAVENPIEEPNK
jgi:hypothetical protein